MNSNLHESVITRRYSIGRLDERRSHSALAFLAMFGTTSVSVVLGAQSGLFLVVAGLAAILSIQAISKERPLSSKPNRILVLLLACLAVSFIAQQLQQVDQPESPSDFRQSAVATAAMASVLLIVFAVSKMQLRQWRLVSKKLTVLCGLALTYGAVTGGALEIQPESGRFSSEAIGTAAWAEIALGVVLLCIMSEFRVASAMFVPIALYIIVIAEMRIAGIAASVALTLYWFLRVKYRTTKHVFFLFVIGGLSFLLLAISLFGAHIIDILRAALLLDDVHRGINSGFSGRFDNFAAGLAIADDNLFFGVGPLDATAGYTHNGYIKVFAQYGIVFGMPFMVFLVLSLFAAFRGRSPSLIASIVALLIFYAGQPRHLNLQLMPLVGLIACCLAYTQSYGRTSVSSREVRYPSEPFTKTLGNKDARSV